MNVLRRTVFLAALVLTGASARAQGPIPSGVGIPGATVARAGLDPSAGTMVSPLAIPQEARGRKEPVVAGALSLFLFPGLGSFYAGSPRHGVLHVLGAVASATVIVVGATDCVTRAAGGKDCNDGVITAGMVAFGVNWIWSVFTAVSDASAYNRR